MTTLTVTPDGKGNYLVRIWAVNVTLTADELRTLWIAAGDALFPRCEHCTERVVVLPGRACVGCEAGATWAYMREVRQ